MRFSGEDGIIMKLDNADKNWSTKGLYEFDRSRIPRNSVIVLICCNCVVNDDMMRNLLEML